MKCARLLTFLTLATVRAVCQQDSPLNDQVEHIADELFAIQDLDLDYSELYENLLQIQAQPLDLNEATPDQLRSLYILSPLQISNLLDYRETSGPFYSVYELQTIDGFDETTLSRLLSFVKVSNPKDKDYPLVRRILRSNSGYLLLRYQRTIEQRRGYQNPDGTGPAYAGTPDQMYARLRMREANDFSLGFTIEKDAGEKLAWKPEDGYYGADYYSVHFQLQDQGKIKNLILGDFQAQFGQGLSLGGGFGLGKGGETVTTTRRSNLGFLPYTSLNESSFFRGAALTYAVMPGWDIHAFYSQKLADGSLSTDSLQNTISITSINYTGLHRTLSEQSKRKINKEQNAGLAISYERGGIAAGGLLHANEFDIPINANPSLYNQFYFRGSRIVNLGAYLNYNWRNFSFFSEFNSTIGQGNGAVAGFLGSLSNRFEVSVLFRKYDRNYQSFYGNAFAENSSPQNETGLYWGWKYHLNRSQSFSGYVDMFRFPWLKYRTYSPSQGYEWLLRYNYQPSKTIRIYAQAREERKARNLAESITYRLQEGVKRNYWINADYDVSETLSFKTRIQYSTYALGAEPTDGFVIVQDMNVEMGRFEISARYALFDTDDYDNRQYVYERDVWLAYSIPAYFDVGVRTYVMVQYSLNSKVNLWLRWAQTSLNNEQTIGSGLQTIEGSKKNDVKFQVSYKF